ncbi:hypothetical protein FF38_03883, partial [Lucilia cuprina]
DAAHQVLFTVASVTVGIDIDGAQEEILYVPLITSLSRGNIFSQTLTFVQDSSDINHSAIRSRWAVHAPNISLEHHQLPTIVKTFLKASGNSNEVQTNSTFADVDLSDYQSYFPKLDLEIMFSDPATKAVCDGTDEYYSGDGLFVAEAHSLRVSLKASHDEEKNSYEMNTSMSLRNSKLYYNSDTIPRNHSDSAGFNNGEETINAYEEELQSDSDDSSKSDADTTMDSVTKKKRILRFHRHSKNENRAPSILSTDSGNSKDGSHNKSLFSKVLPHKANPVDVEIMLKRASNYQAIRHLRVHPMELTVSYRGNSNYSILNIQNLRIPMSDILIENKTWSRLDLIMKCDTRTGNLARSCSHLNHILACSSKNLSKYP